MKLLLMAKVLIGLLIALYVYSLWHRAPDIDDAWIGEHAYWMAHNGYVKSELMHGITAQEIRHIVHHKAFTLTGAGFILLFGFSLMSLKAVSLFWILVFLMFFYTLMSNGFSKETMLISILFWVSNALVFQFSFVYRPEIMVMAIGFLSFAALVRALHNTQNQTGFTLLSGLMAGMAAATHLNGLIYIAAGGVVLLAYRKLKFAVIFSLAVLPTFAIYFYDFISVNDFHLWLYQINQSPALKKSTLFPSSLAFLAKISREHLRFFHSPKEISLSLLLLFSLFVNFQNLKRQQPLLLYLLVLVISLSLLSVHSTSKYILLYLPFIALVILYTFSFLNTNRNSGDIIVRNLKYSTAFKIWMGLFVIYLGTNIAWNFHIANQKFDPEENKILAEKYMGKSTSKLNVLAPMNFIFNEMGKFKRIQGDLSLSEMGKGGKQWNPDTFWNYADSMKIDYLLLTKKYELQLNLPEQDSAARIRAGYRLEGITDGIQVYKHVLPHR